jgi:hypothetical protein
MNEQAQNLVDSLKGPRLPKWGSPLLYAAFLLGTMVINYTANHTHAADVQAQQEKRISALENDSATRTEVQALSKGFEDNRAETRTRLERIENLLLQIRQRNIR